MKKTLILLVLTILLAFTFWAFEDPADRAMDLYRANKVYVNSENPNMNKYFDLEGAKQDIGYQGIITKTSDITSDIDEWPIFCTLDFYKNDALLISGDLLYKPVSEVNIEPYLQESLKWRPYNETYYILKVKIGKWPMTSEYYTELDYSLLFEKIGLTP